MPIVALGEDYDRALAKQAIEAGADNFLFKPISDGNRIALGILYAQQQRAAIKRTRHNEFEAFLAHLQVDIEKKNDAATLTRHEALTQFVLGLQSFRDFDYRASVLLLQDGCLFLGAAPNLPDEYNQAIEGVAIGPGVGSCGTAAFSRQTVYVVDIETDPLWAPYKVLAAPHGLKACWSVPIVNDSDVLLGTFAMYYDQPRFPSEAEREFIHLAAKTAARLLNIFSDE
ncbi:MAG: GAF domain-containing protein [Cyanobacteria bacterium SZAS-4]|nr:GAF domain-containing protein [Cyanobacteria bacterium SZAS-4]